MTIEAQFNAKQKERFLLCEAKDKMIELGLKTNDELWRGEGRKDYDNLCKEIQELSKKLPYLEFDNILCEEKYLTIKVGIIDLDEIKMLFVDGENGVSGEDSIEVFKTFLAQNPEYCYTRPYDGNITYFFSKKPTIFEIDNTVMLHRGACGEIKNCPKNALIIMDMD